MPGTTRYNYGAGAGIIDSFAVAVTQINQTLGQLDSSARQTLAEWDNDAQREYAGRKAAWDQAAAGMGTSLDAAVQALSNVHQTFAVSDRQAANVWRR